MSFRTIVVSQPAKLSFKDNYLLIRGDSTNMVHLSEIHTIMIESTMVQITTRLMNELLNFKIKLIICDERHNPSAEMMAYNASYNSSKKITNQIAWEEYNKDLVWMHIIANKISNQAKVLEENGCDNAGKLRDYIKEIELGDITNREGHSAKVYFNSLFGKEFSRTGNTPESRALDYGYTILLSAFNRCISNLGYLNQLGVKHKNEFNPFNLACDFIEPFRVLVDAYVAKNKGRILDSEYKQELVNILNQEIRFDNKNILVINAIPIYIARCVKSIEENEEYLAYDYGV